MTYPEVVTAIMNGDIDENLHELWGVINQRHRMLRTIRGATLASTIKKGDVLKILPNIRPKKLGGLHVEVLKVNQTTATVKITNETEKFLAGKWGTGYFDIQLSSLAREETTATA